MNDLTIDVNTLQNMLVRGDQVTLLDVRYTENYQEWAIPRSGDDARLDSPTR